MKIKGEAFTILLAYIMVIMGGLAWSFTHSGIVLMLVELASIFVMSLFLDWS